METKFTKGEWKVNNNSFTLVHGLKTSEVHNTEEWICYVRGNTNVEMEANAKLIAAAPDMLEALKIAVKKYEDEMTNPFCMEWFKKAKEAIKKATE